MEQNFKNWVDSLGEIIIKARFQTFYLINTEMQIAFMFIGRELSESKFKKEKGINFYKKLAEECEKSFSMSDIFEENNLPYIEKFYTLYKSVLQGKELTYSNISSFAAMYFALIPWTHQKEIIDASEGNFEKAKKLMNKTIENSWSLAQLREYIRKI